MPDKVEAVGYMVRNHCLPSCEQFAPLRANLGCLVLVSWKKNHLHLRLSSQKLENRGEQYVGFWTVIVSFGRRWADYYNDLRLWFQPEFSKD